MAILAAWALAMGDGAAPAAEPALDPPTLRSLGAAWVVSGDDNRNAKVELHVRKAGSPAWTPAAPLFRVERGAQKAHVPAGAWLFAGSAVLLDPDTAYELRLTLSDPDGGGAERVLRARTRGEPAAPAGIATCHVVPGKGGGKGTAAEPFRGLKEAQGHAKPGTLFLLGPGVYSGSVHLYKSGEPGQPVIWRGAEGGATVLDAQGDSNAITAGGVHDVWLERITFRNALKGVGAGNSARMVVRRCRFEGLSYAVVVTVNENDAVRDFFISDNVIEGPCTWPRTKGIESPRGIQVTGTGHVVCHNRIRGFADAIDTMPSDRCLAIDVHNNEISEQTDDGIELDFSERNVRCFENRLTNVFQGVSLQPVHGGPVYAFRNVMYNVGLEPFKAHSSPSGAIMFHNTVVKKGGAHLMLSPEPIRNCVSRNNLFVGTAGDYGIQMEPRMPGCDFDYDGIAGGPWNLFLKWDGARYETANQARARAPAYRNAVVLDAATLFEAGVAPPERVEGTCPASWDPRLKAGSGAVDAGQALPGWSDGFAGAAPDLGACELGAPLPVYGPRPEK